jgi:hypothetical protein
MMSELKCTFSVDGVNWTKSQLERLEYERNLHTLHQMKRHKIEIKDGNKVLSDDDIDYLSAEKAWEVSIEARATCKSEKIIELYKDSLAKSDELWKTLGFAQNKPMKVSHCDMVVSGLSLQKFMGIMRGLQEDEQVGLSAHPEHFICNVQFDDGKIFGIEPFGMFGTPTLVNVTVVDVSELGAQIQSDKDPKYPISMSGRAFLTDGVTEVNSPFHQLRPTEDGFEAKTAVYWPENTPDEIVNGHSLHLAMEFCRGLQLSQNL